MPLEKLPIHGSAYKNVDESSLQAMSPLVYDAMPDENGNTVKRPGLLEWIDLGTDAKVDGVYWWDNKAVLLAVSNGSIFRINSALGTILDVTGDALTAGTRVRFAEDGTYAVMANGGKMVTYNNSGTTAFMADGDAPTSVSHVAYLDQRILANKLTTNQWQWSDAAASTAWNSLSFATADTGADNLLGLDVHLREVVLIGKETMEFWVNDGSTPFVRVDQAYVEQGCAAVHSVAFFNNTWHWLNDKRRVVTLQGRTPTVISIPFDKDLAGFATISDASAMTLSVNNREVYVLTFPTEKRTLVYDPAIGGWTDWSYWNLVTASREAWRGNCYAYCKDWNLHIVGDRANGKLYKMSPDYHDDNGDLIRVQRRTGHVTHGSMRQKRSNRVIFWLKRGVATSLQTNPYMMVRWRNDNQGWHDEEVVSLGAVGDTDLFTAEIRNSGMYRSRQWELTYTDATEFILVDGEEDFDWMLH